MDSKQALCELISELVTASFTMIVRKPKSIAVKAVASIQTSVSIPLKINADGLEVSIYDLNGIEAKAS